MSDYGKVMRNIGECLEACKEPPVFKGLLEKVATGEVFAVSFNVTQSDGTMKEAYCYDFTCTSYSINPAEYRSHAENLKNEFICMGMFHVYDDEYEN